jgi:hypothetical protein
MLGFAKIEIELVPVEDDAAVREAAKPLREAQAKLEEAEAEEQRLIRVVTSDAHRATDDQIEEAHQRLSIRKGSQSNWYLEGAQSARDEVRALRTTYQAAAQAARTRLEEAGRERLKSIMAELHPLITNAQRLALEIEGLRQAVGQGGGDCGGHPVPSLLPGEIVDFQIGIAKAQGLL